MNPARALVTLRATGMQLHAFACHCGARIWPRQAYNDHLRQAHGGAGASERVCVRCHRKKLLVEFTLKDGGLGMVCKQCRRHADKGRKRSVRSKKAGRKRQYSNVNLVLSDRAGFRSV